MARLIRGGGRHEDAQARAKERAKERANFIPTHGYIQSIPSIQQTRCTHGAPTSLLAERFEEGIERVLG